MAGNLANLQGGPSTVISDQLLPLVQRATIAPGQIAVCLDAAELAQGLDAVSDRFCSEALTIAAPFQHRKRGVETRLILPGRQVARDPILLRNIARAHLWLDQIKAGRSFEQIAADAGTSKRRVQQVVGQALLAPDIISDALQGKQRTGLTTRWYCASQCHPHGPNSAA